MGHLANATDDSILLLYAGRISPEKNVSLLVDLMGILEKEPREFRLLVAGDGPQRDWLKNQCEKAAPGKVALLGHLDKEKLASFYANADIFVHPNPKEPFGIAPLEAMASGVPTVAPNAGGILSYATNENAWLVEPDAEEFARAIREIVNDPVLRDSKVEKAVVTARINSREASTDRLLSTYDTMFEDFVTRNGSYVGLEKPKGFDYWQLLKVIAVLGIFSVLEYFHIFDNI
jgi:glycosyltransferase involved in cell wall biosynthesis